MHVDSCLRQAVSFLGSVQLPHGEFKTLIGTHDDLSDGVFDSSPFTTTFVTYALQEVDQINVGGMLRKGLNFLEQQREIGGLWRFYSSKNYKHTRIPPDLDDTACASFVLQQAGRRSHNEWAFRYLQDDDGRFLTWFLPMRDAHSSLRASLVRVVGEFEARSCQRFTNRPPWAASDRLLATEFDPVPSNDLDPVVNANAVLYLGESKLTEAAIEYLIRSVPMAQDGQFSLYYRDKLTLLHAVARAYRHSAPSLRALDGVLLAEVGARAASGNLFRSAQSAAMGASVLMNVGADGSILEEAIDAIMGFQLKDGSFKEQAFYSGPAEYWGSPELTTAFCIEALARYGKLAHGRIEGRTAIEPEVNWNPEGVLTGPEGVDADWYLARYPDAAGHASAAAHYAHHGWKEGKDPNPKFSTTWYLSANPDVATAQINPLLHYLVYGRTEGRTPVEPREDMLTGPEGVDADWYLARYPDAAGHASAAAHYARHGWKEGKDPNPKFSTAWYLSDNPDVAAARINPLLHYLNQGRIEGRTAVEPEANWNPEGVLTGPEGVDADWYLARYPDAAGHASAAAHYTRHGWKEGKDPNPKFSTAWYLSDNPDVAIAGINPLLHYLNQGRIEGRTAVEPEANWNPEGVLTGPEGVDADWYLARYPDAAGHASAAAHYAHHGWKEGKDPNPKFSTAWYLSDNPDVATTEINPLLHYLRHGRMEGRRSAPAVSSIIRARDWWPSKVTLALASGFATLLQIDAPVTSSLLEIFLLAVGIIVCAVYVSFINDLSDVEQDAVVGKNNIFLGKSIIRASALIALSLLAGIAISYMWKGDLTSVIIYAASWVSFSLYSLRPFRLKERAHLGVIADACGAHLFPAVLAATLVSHSYGAKADLSWLACVGVWSFCLGLRSVISHQVDDERNDAGAGIETYVRRVGNTRALFISEYLLLPLEVLAFAIMLIHVGSTVVVVTFVGYALVTLANRASHRTQMSWSSLAILSPYYALLFPLSLLLASASAHLLDVIAVVLFVAIFHRAFRDTAKSLYGQTKRAHFPERLTFKLEANGPE
jgi:1,4-dihydroxy-2-naphthoate octaprenyltransferase